MTDDNHIEIGLDELSDDHQCPGCLLEFSPNDWRKGRGYDDKHSETTTYHCPINGCSGKITVRNG